MSTLQGGNGSGGVGGAGLPEHILALHSGDKLVRCAAYIGSFPVEGADQRQRTEFVHQQLEAMQGCGRSRPVQLWIALTGVKVCDHTGEQVLMAHALRRISYANCNPDHQQFAFMAREPKTQVSLQYCHAFVTDSAQLAEELNNLLGDCFKLAYALQQQQEQRKKQQQQQQQQQQQLQQLPPPQPAPTAQQLLMNDPTLGAPNRVGSNSGLPSSLDYLRRINAFALSNACGGRQPAQPSAPGAPVENFRSAYGNPVIVLKECIDQSVTSGGGILVGPAALAAGGSGGRDTVDAPTIGRNLVNNNGFSVGTAAPSATDVESPPPPLPLRYDSLRPSSSDRTLEPPLSSELTPAAWYQADLPRDLALELLSREEIGGFIVRDSSTHVNCYALSVRVPRQDNPSGYAHYLIQRTARGVKLKGLPKEWPSLQSLVCHLSVMPEMLPCPLRLPRQQENPIYSEHPPVPPGAGGSGGGGPANPEPEDLAGQACPYGLNLPPDEDYQRLSDFSSIMAELRV
ncbi:hypothetical protein BOX15_Mlig017979g1 [Macrostomum lignano]|uniref:SH2 domain-containing protein n=1 Tax=Macrostomum lignano TaxID=282301 RepID=A0A267GTR7_9PLAT|nr:hypothetical protein BOX15_Mlig017979g1 [Macrostomum lignano]